MGVLMFVRMAYWNCKQDCWGADAALFETGAVPVMQGHAGFVRAMLLAVPGSEQRIAFTVWQNKEAYRTFVEGPDLDRITRMFAHMYAEGNLPEPMEYEVRAQGTST
jgi:hypothetical protein